MNSSLFNIKSLIRSSHREQYKIKRQTETHLARTNIDQKLIFIMIIKLSLIS